MSATPKRVTAIKPLKAWAVILEGKIWCGAVFPSRQMAREEQHNFDIDSKPQRIIPVTITPRKR